MPPFKFATNTLYLEKFSYRLRHNETPHVSALKSLLLRSQNYYKQINAAK